MAKTSMGLDENIAGALCYVLGWVSGIIFLLLEKENQFVRFHAWQAIATFLPLTILIWIFQWFFFWAFFIGGTIIWLLGVLWLILWLVLMFKAYQGEKYKLPLVGDFAEKQK